MGAHNIWQWYYPLAAAELSELKRQRTACRRLKWGYGVHVASNAGFWASLYWTAHPIAGVYGPVALPVVCGVVAAASCLGLGVSMCRDEEGAPAPKPSQWDYLYVSNLTI